MFIFKGVNKADGTMMVFDDSDNTMSSVTYSDLKDALQGGTEVQGCYLADDGEMMSPFRVLSASRHLKITVEVGFVVGIIAAITPTGSAMRR